MVLTDPRAKALYLSIRQAVIMLLTALDTYGLEQGYIKERAYVPSRDRGRHESSEEVADKVSGAA